MERGPQGGEPSEIAGSRVRYHCRIEPTLPVKFRENRPAKAGLEAVPRSCQFLRFSDFAEPMFLRTSVSYTPRDSNPEPTD